MPVLPKTLLRALSAAIVLALPAAAALAAQEAPAALEARAASLHDQPISWQRAAGLYREAAGLRSVDDPLTVRDLRLAAKMSYYAGSRLQSVRDLERAADVSLATGEVLSSAMDLVDAAIVAVESGRSAKALELAARSRALAQDPVLDAVERNRILRRVGAAETLALR